MAMTAIILAAATSAALPAADQVRWFPGPYFESRARIQLQRAAMERWPGPAQLLDMWRDEKLPEEKRLAILLGGAAFHDPQLLPLYREAIASDSQRLRQGAAYGYRDLLADLHPNVTAGVNAQESRLLGEEMDTMAETLQRHSLLALWLESALAREGASLPDWQGVVLDRPSRSCFEAVESLAVVDDLDLLVTTYRLSTSRDSRLTLMQLIEGLSLDRFIVMPSGSGGAWGAEAYDNALKDLDRTLMQWSHGGCTIIDGESVLRANLRKLGVDNVDPLGPEGCDIWLEVLQRGLPAWWMLASRRLYACGGPWIELSTINRNRAETQERRPRLLGWYSPPRPKVSPPTPRSRQQ
ncbi:MAG: hypothetical protein P8Y93_09850 [Acidobacteriota bacterium]